MPTSKTQKHGLGRGFESLIPTDLLDESFDPTAGQDQQVSELRQIKLDEIKIDEEQPRKDFDQDHLNELAASIKGHGVIQPIIVTPFRGGYQIVAGERRYRAAKMVGLHKIPALVRTLNNQRKLEVSLIENLQRKDLNVMEIATAYLKLRTQFNLSLEQIRERVGSSSVSAVSNRLRLLRLPKIVTDRLIDGTLSEGQARPLIILDEDVIKKILPKIINEAWSTRKVEQFVVDFKKNLANESVPKSEKIIKNPYLTQLEQIKNRLKTDVNITTTSRGSGFIKIKFDSEDEFNRIQKIIG